jgi:hypothetical protein
MPAGTAGSIENAGVFWQLQAPDQECHFLLCKRVQIRGVDRLGGE